MTHDHETLTPQEQAAYVDAAERFERGDYDDALRATKGAALRGQDAQRSGRALIQYRESIPA